MGDVNNPNASVSNGEGTPTTPSQEPVTMPTPSATPAKGGEATVTPQGGDSGQTPEATPGENRTVPYSRFKQINERLKKVQRDLASQRGNQVAQATSPEDLAAIESHPMVRDLQMKVAESQLRQGAEDILSEYPKLPSEVRKAIMRNPRGFVGPNATTVDEGLLDIQDYVEGIVEEISAGATPVQALKTVPMAGSNQPAATQAGASPAEIQKILARPVDSWTKAEIKTLEEYKATQ